MADQIFDERAAGVYLGGNDRPISPRTFQRWRQRGLGPKFCRVGRQIRYRQSDLDGWLLSRVAQSTADRTAATEIAAVLDGAVCNPSCDHPEDRMSKFLYRTSEAKTALGCGTTTLYALINSGRLEASRLGKRTYITAESLEAFVGSLPPVETPTMARVRHARWSGSREPRAKPQEDKPGAAE